MYRTGRRLLQTALALAIAAASVPYAYLQMFSQFQIYDDEGYIMTSLKTFLDGRALYDGTFSQYGPFYYLAAGLLYRVSGLPVGHDVTRIATIAAWIATAALAAAFVYVVTRSYGAALVVYLQTVLHGTSLIGEPGHPQGLLLVLVGALLLAGSARTRPLTIVLGVVAGCIVMTKINVGVFAAGACLVALLAYSSGHKGLRVLAGAGFSALPFVLMRESLGGPALAYALTAASAIAACCIAAFRLPVESSSGLRPAGRFVGAAAATTFVIGGLTAAMGTSIRGLFEGVLAAPLRFGNVYGLTWTLPSEAVRNGAWSLGLAVVVALLPSEAWRARIAAVLKVAFALLMLRAAAQGPVAMAALAPFVWVVLVPADASSQSWFPRALIALTAASQLLVAYPVAGNQQAWATIWLLPAAVTGGVDGVAAWWRARGAWAPRLADAALAAAVLVWFFPIYTVTGLEERYRVFASLDLPHSNLIRLPRAQKRTYHALVDAVRTNCDALVTMPGLDSFHFWTRLPPLTGFNATAWMTLFDAPTQQRIVQALDAHPSACVIYHDGLMRGWVGARHVDDRPLVKYIRASFHTVRTVDDYELMVRNGRQPPP